MHRGLLLRRPALSFPSSFLFPTRSKSPSNLLAFTRRFSVPTVSSVFSRRNFATQASPAANALRRHFKEFPAAAAVRVVAPRPVQKVSPRVAAALQRYHEDREKNPERKASLETYHELIAAFCADGRVETGMKVFEEMVSHGYPAADAVALESLIMGYARVGRMKDAMNHINELERRGIPLTTEIFNWLIYGFKLRRDLDQALLWFDKLKAKKLPMNAFTVSLVVGIWTEKNDPPKAMALLNEALEAGVALEPRCFNPLMGYFSRRLLLGEAQGVLTKMAQVNVSPDITTYNILLETYRRLNMLREAVDLFRKLKQLNLAPNSISYALLIEILADNDRLTDGMRFLETMRQKGILPLRRTYNYLIDALGRERRMEEALKLVMAMKNDGFMPDRFTYNALIRGFGNANQMRRAEVWLKEMERQHVPPDRRIYHSLILGFCKNGLMAEAVKWFEYMKTQKIKPNSETYNVIISGFCKDGSIAKGLVWMRRMEMDGLPPTPRTFNVLIAAFASLGRFDEAKAWLREMTRRNLTPSTLHYNTLLHHLHKHNRFDKAQKLYKEMTAAGLSPDHTTRLLLLRLYAQTGKIAEARAEFDTLRNERPPHLREAFEVMIKLYAQHAKSNEASGLVKQAKAMGWDLSSLLAPASSSSAPSASATKNAQ